MGQLGFVEQIGFGVPLILRHYGREAFDLGDNHITVTLRFPFEMSGIPLDASALTESESSLLKALSASSSATRKDLMAYTGFSSGTVSVLYRRKERSVVSALAAPATGR